jgi:hypothetical protein
MFRKLLSMRGARYTQVIHSYSLAKIVWAPWGWHPLSHQRNFLRPINVVHCATSRSSNGIDDLRTARREAEQCSFIASLLPRS